jgi:hypothetical protein
MKKFLIGLLMFLVFAVTVPISADAQTCSCRRRSASRSRVSRSYAVRSYQQRRPSFWSRHRNTRNMLLATGGGALLGGLIGGSRRGIGYGALAGAGAGALYTFVIKPKRKVRRY